MTGAQQRQKEHFDRIMSEYEMHYDDPCSQRYRRRFLDGPLLAGVDLSGRRVLEAMCGSGQTTAHLLSLGAHVTGLDISEEGIESFRRRWPQCDAVRASVVESDLEDEAFDCVVIQGGLHHLHPDVDKAIDEIHRVLKPGGVFCFAEPHAGSLPDVARKAWYRRDKYFEDNEASIDLAALKERYRPKFDFVLERYGGNVAYLLVLQSLILRIPLWMKPALTGLLLPIEAGIQIFQGRRLSCFAICQWRKRA